MKSVFEFKVNSYNASEMHNFLRDFQCFYDNDDIFYWVNRNADVIKVKREGPNCFLWRYITRNNTRVIRVENKVMRLNRIVADYFVPNRLPPSHYAEIRHKDGNPKNCAADNLEWISRNRRVKNYREEHKLDIMLKQLNKLARAEDIDLDDVVITKLEED